MKLVIIMNSQYLNEMIKYIEENLDKEIDIKTLSKITYTNLFVLESIFNFLTNMTINEYIKKRRLSKAFEEIRNTDNKIIEIAFKYGYNSASSFNRAFKNLFNITPTECRKGLGNYKIIPIELFKFDKKLYNFDYQIKEFSDIKIYCFHIYSEKHSDLLYKIRQLYKEIKKSDYYEKFNENGMCGIIEKCDNKYHYYLGSRKKYANLDEFIIKSGKYIIFKLDSRDQNEIINFDKKINIQLLPSTNYKIKNNIKIEYYLKDGCYISLPIV